MNELLSIISENKLFENIFIGVIGAIILKIFHILYKNIVNLIYVKNNFSISGFWVASFDSYIEDKKNIEIIHIKQKKDFIYLYGEQYNNLSENTRKFKGVGIFRGADITTVYYPANKNDIQTGALVLRVTHSANKATYLSGIFTEFSYSENLTKINKGKYEAHRLNISIFIRIRFLIKRKYFNSYTEVSNYKEKYILKL